MKLRTTTAVPCAVAVLALTAACGNGDPGTPKETSTPSATATTPTGIASGGIASGEPVPAELDVAPGRIGRVEVGMSKQEVLSTGYFDADVKIGGDECPTVAPLQWKKPYQGRADVFTDEAGSVLALGIFKDLETDKGVGVGSTLGEVNDAYGGDVSPAQEAGYSQAGVYVAAGDKWLGFLVDEEFAKVTPESKVTFMEVTVGRKPDLMRDGC